MSYSGPRPFQRVVRCASISAWLVSSRFDRFRPWLKPTMLFRNLLVAAARESYTVSYALAGRVGMHVNATDRSTASQQSRRAAAQPAKWCRPQTTAGSGALRLPNDDFVDVA